MNWLNDKEVRKLKVLMGTTILYYPPPPPLPHYFPPLNHLNKASFSLITITLMGGNLGGGEKYRLMLVKQTAQDRAEEPRLSR